MVYLYIPKDNIIQYFCGGFESLTSQGHETN